MERKATALKPLFNQIVDAIHDRDGLSDGISAQDFPDRIRAIPTGVTLSSIAVTTPPNKTTYIVGDVFDPSGMVVTATLSNGNTFPVDSESLSFYPSGALTEEDTIVTISFSWGGSTKTTNQTIAVITAQLFGAEWDGSASTKLSRTDAAEFFTDPVPAVGNGPGSSPFDNLMPWSGMRKVIDGENVLVSIPKYWVKVSHMPFKVQISPTAIDGFQVSPAHRDREDGQGERDIVYIGRYECDSSYMSRSGHAPKTNENLATFRSGIHGIGVEYWQADYSLQLTLWFLYIVEFADWDSQSTIGQGNVNSSAPINTGATDSMTYHTGRAAGTNGHTAVQYRNIENPWGNVREWRDGIVFSNANISTYNNPANFSNTYNETGSTIRSNKRATTSGSIKAWGYDTNDPSFIYPSESDGSETKFIPDRCYYNTGVRALNVGGTYSQGTYAGLFFLYGYYISTDVNNSLGSRIQKLPNSA